MLIKLTDKAIDPIEARQAVAHPSCGAIVTFEGTIRSSNEDKPVTGLKYDAYENFMSIEVERIIKEIRNCWQIHEVALIQRIGKLAVGEAGIVMAVSSPHRDEAFEASRYLLEEFKKRAPVWKKESYETGAEWLKSVSHYSD